MRPPIDALNALRYTRSMQSRARQVLSVISGSLLFFSSPQVNAQTDCSNPRLPLEKNEVLISILGTNDFHGAIAPKTSRNGESLGGMAFWSGAVRSIREGVKAAYGERGGVLLLDGGDQFQGTLLSNSSEGALMFSLLNDAGYDAIVPGNHDYDFGPEGWLVDQLSPGESGDPRGAVKKLAGMANFPMLSANTYLKASLKNLDGKSAKVENVGCTSNEILDWSHAERPEFLKPYLIKIVAGVRVAIVGLDNPLTSTTTTIANVSDLCFRPALAEYQSIRTELEGKADLFVIVIHDGDINQDKKLTTLLTDIRKWRADGVDAVIGGHTHQVNRIDVDGVFAIQSGSSGERFGRIDLVFDRSTGKVAREKTHVAAGALLLSEGCDLQTDFFCAKKSAVRVTYDCSEVQESPTALEKIAVGEGKIRPMISRFLGTASFEVSKNYDKEGALTNFLTDVFRRAAGTDIAIINAGGVRTSIPPGRFTYEKLFQILPFNNHAVVLSPMKVSTLVKILEMTSKSCGKHGAVLASGIQVTYRRSDCKSAVDGEDLGAQLLTVQLNDGSVLYDVTDSANPVIHERSLRVATLDFLEAGGSGYVGFSEAPLEKELGIFRELLADELAKDPGVIAPTIDGRFKNVSL
ncbi:MAG: 5'-nucleotidase C-terminal domain-containing protein [Cryobacterium sp.]|nr:5'-nucleotidase C-terminal domain-containing protein [Oligoflexia bacterium]